MGDGGAGLISETVWPGEPSHLVGTLAPNRQQSAVSSARTLTRVEITSSRLPPSARFHCSGEAATRVDPAGALQHWFRTRTVQTLRVPIAAVGLMLQRALPLVSRRCCTSVRKARRPSTMRARPGYLITLRADLNFAGTTKYFFASLPNGKKWQTSLDRSTGCKGVCSALMD